MSDVLAWRTREAPSLEVFEAIADDAFARLPDTFRALCAGIVIRVEDFPEEDVLEEMEAETPFDLLGLFQGIGLAQEGAVSETGRLPNMVFLYRRPILDYWAENEETLGAVIAHVLIHEIGHHFGLSDADMERVEAALDTSSDADSRASLN
ncbi:MAG: Zn-dependent protease [Rhizobiales bacterium 32-66-8]|nr:MAG: Zn-dependent protease [Rhizobiales bacterium 32-66-8]